MTADLGNSPAQKRSTIVEQRLDISDEIAGGSGVGLSRLYLFIPSPPEVALASYG